MTLTVPTARDRLDIEVSGRARSSSPAQWSDWVRSPSASTRSSTVHGYARFGLASVEPEVGSTCRRSSSTPRTCRRASTSRRRRVRGTSSPSASACSRRWAGRSTPGRSTGTVDEQVFLEDVEQTVEKERKMLRRPARRGRLGRARPLLRVHRPRQHMCSGASATRKHPAYDAAKAPRSTGGAILEVLPDDGRDRRRDGAGADAGGRDLIVVSDHGFASWRAADELQHLAGENGYLVLKGEDAERAEPRGPVRRGRVLRERGLVEDQRLRDGARATSTST